MKTIPTFVRSLHDRGAWRAVDQMVLLLAAVGARRILFTLMKDERSDLRRLVAEAFDEADLRRLLAHRSERVRDAASWGLTVREHLREGRLAGRLVLACLTQRAPRHNSRALRSVFRAHGTTVE